MSFDPDLADKSKAQTYLSDARSEIADINGINLSIPTLPIRKAAVVGAGHMGTGIAIAYANAGISVLLKEASQDLVDKAFAVIAESYERLIRKGRLTESQAGHRLNLIRPAFGLERLSDVDIVIEAVDENLALKNRLFEELNTVVGPETILATSTSTLDIDAVASAAANPSRVVGLHFSAPADATRLVEIVRGSATSDEVVASSFALAAKLNKIGVVVGNRCGFAGNRMYYRYQSEAQFLAEEGSRVEEIDAALRKFGMLTGPLEAMDASGLDAAWQIQKDLVKSDPPELRRPAVIGRLCQQGRLGHATRTGWYRHLPDRKEPAPDPDVEKIIEECAREAGIKRRAIRPEEIIERTVYSLVNEGARILDEGIVRRAAALDIILTAGYGFPEWRGGPMWFADETGLDSVLKRICGFEQQLGPQWTPARLLKKLADEGKRFSDFDA